MDYFYDHIQYVVPENFDVVFSIFPETRGAHIKLLNGVADIYTKDKQFRLALQQDFSMKLWDCSCPRLKTKTSCNFLVRGNHSVSSAVQHGREEDNLFRVFSGEDSYLFVLDKDIQLQIFPVKSTQEESCIKIRSTQGAPEISGFKLPHKTFCDLFPYSPIFLKSSDVQPYSVCVKGLDRKVKLSILDKNHHKCVNDVKEKIFIECLLLKHMNLTILVLGPKYAGKTSFCQSLQNEALEKNMTPFYVDLNIKRNLIVPGSLIFSKVKRPLNATQNLTYNILNWLHYGYTNFKSVNLRFYFHLIQKLGEFVSSYFENNSKENCLSIIDTAGSSGVENDFVLKLILKSFAVDLVVYIGDEHDYENLKKSTLEKVQSKFIPKALRKEKLNDSYKVKYYQHKIRKYFSDPMENPSSLKVCTVELSQIIIYRISPSLDLGLAKNGNSPEFKTDRIETFVEPFMLNFLFAVSTAKSVEMQEIYKVAYYLYFTDIDLNAKTATVVVPKTENFTGGILLMGFVPKLNDSVV